MYGPPSSSLDTLPSSAVSALPFADLNSAVISNVNVNATGGVSSDNEDDEFDDDALFDFDQDAHLVNPLDAAIDQLEDRLISVLDEFKVAHHATPDELAAILRPAIEIGAHAGPATARKHAASSRDNNVDEAVRDVYEHLNVNLLYPSLLEVAQSDVRPVKRAATLQFFHNLHKEYQRPGSYLDRSPGHQQQQQQQQQQQVSTSSSSVLQYNLGPTGDGSQQETHIHQQMPSPTLLQQRHALKHSREVELLHHWIDAATRNIAIGSLLTSQSLEDSVASRAILSANAALRPAFRSIAVSIAAADDTGAMNLYLPVFHMSLGVISRLFLTPDTNSNSNTINDPDIPAVSPTISTAANGVDSVRASCLKFLETLILLCTSKGPRQTQRHPQQRKVITPEDFSLDDLPAGHPTITREALDSVGEFAFTALRGMVLIGGQLTIDTSLIPPLASMISPFNRLLSIVKLAALAFLEIESSLYNEDGNKNDSVMKSLELDFSLAQKSYAVAINGICAVAMNRPGCLKFAAITLARRTMDPPTGSTPTSTQMSDETATGNLTRAGVLVVTSQLKASCLTLLRNPLSANVKDVHEWLHRALVYSDMTIQAEKAFAMAKQQAALRTAGRAARNRAALFYEWDQSEADKQSKRQRETDDALAKLRAAKVARGLGNGIQLPTNMVDACELALLNIKHLPDSRPGAPSTSAAMGRKHHPFSLESLLDAISSNGESLSTDVTRWYDRDGGNAWEMDLLGGINCGLDSKIIHVIEEEEVENAEKIGTKDGQLYHEQCHLAAGDAFGRIVYATRQSKSKELVLIGNQIAARLALTLEKVQPSHRSGLKDSLKFAKDSISLHEDIDVACAGSLMDKFPLASSCLAMDVTKDNTFDLPVPYSLSNRLLFEAFSRCCGCSDQTSNVEYQLTLDVLLSLVAKVCQLALEKSNDTDLKKISMRACANLPTQLSVLPTLSKATPVMMSSICDVEAAFKAVVDIQRKFSKHTIPASAAAHAAKAAAEKRATVALLSLRDIAFQRRGDIRQIAVHCAVAIAAGRIPAPNEIEDKALKLVVNVLYSRSSNISEMVVKSATEELVKVTEFAIQNPVPMTAPALNVDPLEPSNEQEKMVMDHAQKPIVLFLALCVRQPELIQSLLRNASRSPPLAKVVKLAMPKLAKAVAAKYGASEIALKVAQMVDENESSLLLAFLDNLSHNVTQSQEDFVQACTDIQKLKTDPNGKEDPRFIIPAVAVMKRAQLVQRLAKFVGATDTIFKAALAKMSERVGRYSQVFRDETEQNTVAGMTLCEQLVYLHSVDFNAAGIPQKRYLDAIRLCLDDDEVYTDRIIMSALERISLDFMKSNESLPLAYMRTIILTCNKHETLHPWICQVLLPRLIEGKIYNDRRQWEGWMRCAKMLERVGASGATSIDAINKLPEEQLRLYRSKYPS